MDSLNTLVQSLQAMNVQDAGALKSGPTAAKPTGVALEIQMPSSQFTNL